MDTSPDFIFTSQVPMSSCKICASFWYGLVAINSGAVVGDEEWQPTT